MKLAAEKTGKMPKTGVKDVRNIFRAGGVTFFIPLACAASF